MDQAYWNRLAAAFDEDVFDVLGNDRGNVILSHLDRLASKKRSICDFGCGIGRHLPLLAERFGAVEGVDISEDCLRIARQRHGRLDNVRITQADLAEANLELGFFDVGLSVNVVMMPSLATRQAILGTFRRHLRPGGSLLLVVPSFESAMYAHSRLIRWNLRLGHDYDEAAEESRSWLGRPGVCVPGGVLDVGDTPTKHYLKEELQIVLEGRGYDVTAIEKVTYPWTTEFDRPPGWMKQPYPWDWLAVGRKA